MSGARVVAVCVGRARTLPHDPTLTTAFLKERVHGPVRVLRDHLEGDEQAARTVHGGPDRAVLAYAAAHYAAWRAQLGDRAPGYGGLAENLTVDGLDDATVCIGDRYRIGSALLEVSVPRKPCEMISRATRVAELYDRVEDTRRWGWLHRVIDEGTLTEGDVVTRVARPHPTWSVLRVADVMERMRRHVPEAVPDALAAAELTELTEGWRTKLRERAEATLRGARADD